MVCAWVSHFHSISGGVEVFFLKYFLLRPITGTLDSGQRFCAIVHALLFDGLPPFPPGRISPRERAMIAYIQAGEYGLS